MNTKKDPVTEPANVNVEQLNKGDHLEVEVGEWNDVERAWSFNNYRQLGEADGLLVVDTADDHVKVIKRSDEVKYDQSERVKKANGIRVDVYRIDEDGYLGDDGLRLKSYEVVDGRSGEFFIAQADRFE